MNKKTRIIIVGIGGVGGYFGGLLARKFFDSKEVEIIFIARGEHLQKIKQQGLTLIHGKESFTAIPFMATDDFKIAGLADYILLCTKSYDLEETVEQLKPALKPTTTILPLLNGVNSVERIKNLIPDATVLEGCAYIVSHITAPGVVENIGNRQMLFFGLDNTSDERFSFLEKCMREAGIEATLSDKISEIIWKKFIFISAIATATSYYNQPIGAVIEKHEETLFKLIEEVKQIALAKNISLDPDHTSKTISQLKKVPYSNTTSMQRDFSSDKVKTELESLTNYVNIAGRQLNIPTPVYQHLYDELKNRKHGS